MFVVLVTHNTGHGEVTDPVQLTEDIHEAIKTARTIETFGYEFYGDVGVEVCRIQPERRPYMKSEFIWHLGDMPPSTAVFYRGHYRHFGKHSDYWKEDWFDLGLQQLVDENV